MQISSYYNTLFTQVSSLYGSTYGSGSQVSSASSGTGSSGGTDQVDLSEDYLSFQSFLDKVKNGTVTDDDLTKMQEQMNASSQMPPPPPPMQMTGAGEGEETDTIGSFLDKVKNGTVTTDDLTNLQAVLANMGSSNTDTVSSSDSGQLTFESFLDKVKDGTVTEDDLTEMQSLLEEMDENAGNVQNRPPMPPPPMGMMGFGDNSESTDESESSSDSTDSLTLQSFLDKIKDGTVTDDDLTEMQSLLTNWLDSDSFENPAYAQSYTL